jgi:3-dehydroquinate synthase
MVDLLVHNFSIKSFSHSYDVEFNNDLNFETIKQLGTHFIVDKNVVQHIGGNLPNSVYVDVHETIKSYEGTIDIFKSLLDLKLQKNHTLVGIGGGIIQDITCWIASTFMRGISWNFIPTTLLAQADSCIGSKSSINFKSYKNILGSFYPPKKIIINNLFLNTLNEVDIRSGMAEIIKLLIIDKFDFNQNLNINELIFKSLTIKKKFIEDDEFDKGIRNILNYGHCFGHALESITNYTIPHGIAVAMGMDMANALSDIENNTDNLYFKKYHNILKPLYYSFLDLDFDINLFIIAISKDKKNINDFINIIIPYNNELQKTKRIPDSCFKQNCKIIFDKLRD